MPDDFKIKDLARRVKEKYPEYAEVDDTELATRVASKYPEYGEYIGASASATSADNILAKMRGSVMTQESGGSQHVQNPRTSATGLFQVMPANIPNWTKKYHGKTLTPQEFANDRNAQETVFKGEMGKYVNRALKLSGGDEDKAIRMAAAAWYGGEGNIHNYDANWGGKGNEPTFREYTTSVLNRIKKGGGMPSLAPQANPLVEQGVIEPTVYTPVTPQATTPIDERQWDTLPDGTAVVPQVAPPTTQSTEQPVLPHEAPHLLVPQTTDPQVEKAYADFLKQTGLPNTQESVAEFNLANQSSVDLANAENKKAYEIDKKAVAEYNAKLPKQPAPTKQTAQNAQKPQETTVQPTAKGVEISFKYNPNDGRSYSEQERDAMASQFAGQLGIDADIVRDYINRKGFAEGNESESEREAQAKAGVSQRRKLDASAVADLVKIREDLAQRTTKAKADFEARKQKIDPTLSEADRDLEEFRLRGMADIDAGLITPEQQSKAYETLKKDVEAWKEDRGFLGNWRQLPIANQIFDQNTESGWNQKEWAEFQRFMGGRPDTSDKPASESYQPSGLGKEVQSPKDYFNKAYADMQKQYGSASNWVKAKKEEKKRFQNSPMTYLMKVGEAGVGGAMKAPFTGAASALKAIAIGSEALDKVMGTDSKAEDKYSYILAKGIEDLAEGIKVDKDFKGGNAEMLGNVAGQVIVQAGLGIATGGALAPALFGAAQGVAEQYEKGTAEGLDGWTRLGKALVGGLIEAPDYFVFKSMLKGGNALNKIGVIQNLKAAVERGLIAKGILAPVAEKMAVAAADGFVAELIAKGGLKELVGKGLKVAATKGKVGGLEAIQEGTTRPLNDLWAYISYDRSPERWEAATSLQKSDFVEGVAGFFGGIVGAGLADIQTRAEGLSPEAVTQAQEFLKQNKDTVPAETYNDAQTALENRKKYFAKDAGIQTEVKADKFAGGFTDAEKAEATKVKMDFDPNAEVDTKVVPPPVETAVEITEEKPDEIVKDTDIGQPVKWDGTKNYRYIDDVKDAVFDNDRSFSVGKPFDAGLFTLEFTGGNGKNIEHQQGAKRGDITDATVEKVYYDVGYFANEQDLTKQVTAMKARFPNAKFVPVERTEDDPDTVVYSDNRPSTEIKTKTEKPKFSDKPLKEVVAEGETEYGGVDDFFAVDEVVDKPVEKAETPEDTFVDNGRTKALGEPSLKELGLANKNWREVVDAPQLQGDEQKMRRHSILREIAQTGTDQERSDVLDRIGDDKYGDSANITWDIAKNPKASTAVRQRAQKMYDAIYPPTSAKDQAVADRKYLQEQLTRAIKERDAMSDAKDKASKQARLNQDRYVADLEKRLTAMDGNNAKAERASLVKLGYTLPVQKTLTPEQKAEIVEKGVRYQKPVKEKAKASPEKPQTTDRYTKFAEDLESHPDRNNPNVYVPGKSNWEVRQQVWVELQPKSYQEGRAESHKATIRQRIKNGQPVPAEVLADYPDLAPTITKGTTVYSKGGVKGTVESVDGKDLGVAWENNELEVAPTTVDAVSTEKPDVSPKAKNIDTKQPSVDSVNISEGKEIRPNDPIYNESGKVGVYQEIEHNGKVLKRVQTVKGTPTISNTIEYKEGNWSKGVPDETPMQAINASGESSASMEAQSRLKGEQSRGEYRVVVDTRSGNERKLFGVDAVDHKPQPYEQIEWRGGRRDGEVIDRGVSARPYTRKTNDTMMMAVGGKQTDTPEFKKFFGKSQVVDEKGNPLPVKHGTANTEITSFHDGVNFFTPDSKAADLYRRRSVFEQDSGDIAWPDDVSSVDELGDGGIDVVAQEEGIDLNKGVIMPLYLKIEKPLDLRHFDANFDPQNDWDKLQRLGVVDEKWSDLDEDAQYEVESEFGDKALWNFLDAEGHDTIRRKGYDGVIFNDVDTKGKTHLTYATFSPTQIKSAIGNNGEFDPNNPDITKRAVSELDANQSSFKNARTIPTKQLEQRVNFTTDARIAEPGIIALDTVEGAEFTRRLLNENTSFYGVMADPNKIAQVREMLDKMIAHSGSPNLKRLKRLIETAIKHDGTVIFAMTEDTAKHERKHRFLFHNRKSGRNITEEVEKQIVDSKGFKKALTMEWGKNYATFSQSLKVEEYITAVANEEWSTLGVTTEVEQREANGNLIDFAESYAEINKGDGTARELMTGLATEMAYVETYLKNQGTEGNQKEDTQEVDDSNVKPAEREKDRPDDETAGESKPDDVNIRRYSESLRDAGFVDSPLVPYIPGTDAQKAAETNRIIETSDPMMHDAEKMFYAKGTDPKLKGVLGTALIDHLGSLGEIDRMLKVATDTVEYIGTAAQVLQAAKLVAKYDFASGLMMAQKAATKAGRDLTVKEVDNIKAKLDKVAVTTENQATLEYVVEELKAAIAAKDVEIANRDKALQEEKVHREATDSELAKLKKQLAHKKPQTTREKLKETREAREAAIRAQFSDTPMMAIASEMSPELKQNLIDEATLDIFDGKTPEQMVAHLKDLTNNSLSDKEIAEIHLKAWDATGYKTKPTTLDELTVEDKEARIALRERAKARRQHITAVNNLKGERKQSNYEIEVIEYGKANGYTDGEIAGALYIPQVKGENAVEQWKKKIEGEFGEVNFNRAHHLRRVANSNIKAKQLEARHEREQYQGELKTFENDLSRARNASVAAKGEFDNYAKKVGRGWVRKGAFAVTESVAATKGLSTWGEISYILRQGFVPLITDTRNAVKGDWQGVGHGLQGDNVLWQKLAGKAGLEDVAQYLGDHNVSMFIDRIRQHPSFGDAQRHGIRFTQIGDFNIADDHFSVKALEVIPLYKRTEYAYTLPGDLQRLYMFDAWSKVIDGQGLDAIQTKRAKKYAAETINAFTGKGDVKRILASNGAFAKLLNLTFFSPQLLISRFQTINRLTTGFATAPKGMKWQMAKKGMRFYGVIGLLALVTGMVLDPDDDDFGTIRIKVGDRDMRDTRINILAGLDVPAQLYMRTAMGFAKSLVSGEKGYIGDAMQANLTDFVLDKRQTPRFARSKLSPGASFGYDWIDGKDFIGRPTTLWGSVTSRVAPLSWQQAYDAFLYDRYKEMVKEPRDLQYGIEKATTNEHKYVNAIVTIAASFLGTGITQYPKDDPSQALQLARQLSPSVSKKDEETLRQEGGLRSLLKAQITEQGAEQDKAKAAVQRWLQKYPALRAEVGKLLSQAKSKTGLLAYYGKDLNADQLKRVREKATDVDEIKLIDSMIKRATKQKR